MKRKVTEQSAAGRELAQRLSGSDEVLLVWHPEVDRVEVSVRDVVTGAGFHVEVAPDKAIDAFYHPYAYAAAAARGDFDLLERAEATIINGDRRG
jgi:hypothetical protein